MQKPRKMIGVCGACLFNQQPIQFIQQLHEECQKHDYRIAALSCASDIYDNTDAFGNLDLVKLITHLPLCGMIILTETISNKQVLSKILSICREKKIPVFSVSQELEGCYNMVYKNSDGFEQIVRHIIQVHGCKKINMLAGPKDIPVSEERIAAYKKVLTEYHIPIEDARIDYGNFWERPAKEAVNRFLQSPIPLPDAIVCANDSMAIAACSVLREHGYNVPDDIIVTGFDGIMSGQYHIPILTTCAPDYADACFFIIRELERFLISGSFTPQNHDILFIPKINQSCGCVPIALHNLNEIISQLYDRNGDAIWHNIAMNELITENLYNDDIVVLAALIQRHVDLWKDHFRFTCIRASMLSGNDITDLPPEEFHTMVSILDLRSGEFLPVGSKFSIDEFIPDLDSTECTDILIIKLLNSGSTVYGYSVEGFDNIDERCMQRCNDFSFFLSYCLNTIIHNKTKKNLADVLLKANEEISLLSFLDSLTGLYNRRGFYHEVDKLIHSESSIGKYISIFSIDMDGLKYINDHFGHAEGDFAIITVSKAMQKTSGPDAICARFGGDEFIVALLNSADNAYSTDSFYQQLISHILSTDGMQGKPYPIDASIGLVSQKVTAHTNIESMIAAADDIMYQIKFKKKEQAKK